MAEADGLSNAAEVKIRIALDEHYLLHARGKDLRQLRGNILLGEVLIVDLPARSATTSTRGDLHHDGAVILRRRRLVLLGRLGNQRLKTSRGRWNDDHE